MVKLNSCCKQIEGFSNATFCLRDGKNNQNVFMNLNEVISIAIKTFCWQTYCTYDTLMSWCNYIAILEQLFCGLNWMICFVVYTSINIQVQSKRKRSYSSVQIRFIYYNITYLQSCGNDILLSMNCS